MFSDHPAQAVACTHQFIVGFPNLIDKLRDLVCEPGVFILASHIRCCQFVDPLTQGFVRFEFHLFAKVFAQDRLQSVE
ncbi:hypothetical protein RHOER0001_3147 [Rhodococcus erythropolis SK121]|nr:hypothetical protein RHOER0001_3147 [Rhodococcus erythropolis SK121]